MSLVKESYVQNLLRECELNSQREEREARQAVSKRLKHVYEIYKENVKQTFSLYSLDSIIKFTELAVEIPSKFDSAVDIINLFFERVSNNSQFFIRALLVKARIVAYSAHNKNIKGEDMVQCLKQAINFISKALDLIAGPAQQTNSKGKDNKGGGGQTTNKSKYAFLVYNSSTTLYKITRFLLRTSWQRNFADIYERIYKLFDQLDQPDHDWKCRFILILYQCLYDNDKKPDAFKVLDGLWEKTKNKPCNFQTELFRLRVHLSKENNALVAIIKKDIQGADPNGWKILEVLQRMRSGAIPEAQIEKELMTTVNQISLNVLSNVDQTGQKTHLLPLMQQRLAEAGRIALKYGLVNIASSITTFLGKARQPTQRSIILNQYNKAELLIKKRGEFIDRKTGMTMNTSQIRQLQIDNRKESLRLMEKVMLINKKLDEADLIYEGSLLIWNISLPFMCGEYQSYITKAFDVSLMLLEQIDSTDHQLRTKMHLQLAIAYFGNQLMFAEVESNIMKASKLDHSVPVHKLTHKFEQSEDKGLYQRPYQRYLQDFMQKIMLKNMTNINPNELDVVVQDLWSIQDHKSQTTKIDILQKCLKTVINYEEPPFKVNEEEMLVEEEIVVKKIDYERCKLRLYKKRKLLAAEIAKFSFQWELNDFAKKAIEFVLADTWDTKNSIQLVIVQAKCCYYMAQIKIDELYGEGYEPIFQEPLKVNEEEEQQKQPQKLTAIAEKKTDILNNFKKALTLAQSAQQHFLVFNGAIYLWNNFLHIFRNSSNDSKLLGTLPSVLKQFFESMRGSLKEIQTKGVVYYDMEQKIQIFANIGIIYARLLELKKDIPGVEKICEDLLGVSLIPNTRKLVNAVKAKVSGGKAQGGGKADKKGGKEVQKEAVSGVSDNFVVEISSQLEVIQNATNKAQSESNIIKCFESLDSFKPEQTNESELELYVQLWVRLARLALNIEENTKMVKYALKCCEKMLESVGENNNIPANRLRWYSLGEFLYGQALLKLVNPKTQQYESVTKLLFLALERAVAAVHKGFKCGVGVLVLDAAKLVWNISSKLQDSRANRTKLETPLRQTLLFLKELKEQTESDLVLLLSGLYFKTADENNHHKQGQQICDVVLGLVPKSLQKAIWEAKMLFMSKQGKNELQAISSIKEADASLQAKLWVKLARISVVGAKQQAAYVKAIEILKKDHSVEVVEVLVQYSEWLLRVNKEGVDVAVRNLLLASQLLIQIEYDHCIEEEDEGEGDEKGTVYSKSFSKKSQSNFSRSIQSSNKNPKSRAHPSSGKSKASNSRMSRSGKSSNIVKNKNTKTIFSQRQQDPNPQSLNCLHHERLFRIFTILATISPIQSDKVAYMIKAKKEVIKMLEKSVKTFNEMQENAAKFNEKDAQNVSPVLIAIPDINQEWLSFQFPKEYLEKIGKLQNYNFLGSYCLQKPQLTYNYLVKLNDMMYDIGLSFESIPIHFVVRYLCKYILRNDDYVLLEELRIRRCLQVRQGDMIVAELPVMKIKLEELCISEEDRKSELHKSECEMVSSDSNSNIDSTYAPNLVKSLTKSQCWYHMGKVLIDLGQINAAKLYLKQAQTNAKVLGNVEMIGMANVGLAQISYLQGEYGEAIQSLLLGHKLCKHPKNWHRIVYLSTLILPSLRKYTNLHSFFSKIQTTLTELTDQAYDAKQKANIYRGDLVELKQILIGVELGHLRGYFEEMKDDCKEELVGKVERGVEVLRERVDKGKEERLVWNVVNLKEAIRLLKEISEVFEKKGVNSTLVELSSKSFQSLYQIVCHLDRNLKEFTSKIGLPQESGHYNLISILHIQLKLLIVNTLVVLHFSKNKNTNTNKISKIGLETQNEKEFQFLEKLDNQIRLKEQPQPTKLNCLEEALTYLEDLEGHVEQEGLYCKRVKTEIAYVQGLKEVNVESLQSSEYFKDINESKFNFLEDVACEHYLQNGYASQMLQKAKNSPSDYFQYLCKYQHSLSVQSTLSFLQKKLDTTHRLQTALRTLSIIFPTTKTFNSKLLEAQKLFLSATKFPTYQDCSKLLPKNGLTVVLQMDRARRIVHCVALHNQGDGSKIVINMKREIPIDELRKYAHLNREMADCRRGLVKSPIENEAKMEAIIAYNHEKLNNIMEELQKLSKWWCKPLTEFLNTAKEVSQSQQAPIDPKKAPQKDAKKKGGKDEVAAYESPLSATPSGVESMTLLLDEFFYGLPFEQLTEFDGLATISKDTSLFWMGRKMQEIGYQSEINNSNGFGGTSGKYFGYDFKEENLSFKAVSAEVCKVDGIKFIQANDSSTKIPSIGDFSKAFSENGFVQVYGSINFLNHLKLSSLLQNVPIKSRLLVVTDGLNYPKNTLNKFAELNKESANVSLEDYQVGWAKVANLLNITLLRNRWPGLSENVKDEMLRMFNGLGSGYYVGSALRQDRKEPEKWNLKLMNYVHGPAVLRM